MVRQVRQLTVIAVVAILAFGVVAQPAHAQNQVHVVRRGETLSSVAARYGTTTQAIVQANGLPNPNYIYAGQRLIIPGAGNSGAASSGASQPGSGQAYTVRRGDTLFSIASRHGTTVAAIMQANSLRSSLIYVGQRLAISGAGSSGTANSSGAASSGASQPGSGQTYTVRRGDTLSGIAARHGTTVAAIMQANSLHSSVIYAGQRLAIRGAGSSGAASSGVASQAGSGQTYTVRRGDTLFGIATRYGTTVSAIMQANRLGSYVIYVGQQLALPGASAASSGAANSGASQAGSGQAYTVRRGDTLSGIAARHGTTVAAIMQANSLRSSVIYAGQRLTIPGAGSSGTANSSGAASSGAASSSGSGQTYTVRRGDTLFGIAVQSGTTVAAIMQANGLSSYIIYPGQRLKLSGAGSSGTVSSSGAASGGGKRIVIDLSAQRMYVYQNGQLLWNWVVSTGRPGQETAVGHYKVLNKIPNAYAYTWNLQMPYWLGIYWAGSLQNGIHALPIQANGQRLWAGYLGQRVSFGCIILGTQNAKTLYNWARVGIPVDIVW
jgi:LysM repeat protein